MKDHIICIECANNDKCEDCFDYSNWSGRRPTRLEMFQRLFGMNYVPRPGIPWWDEPSDRFATADTILISTSSLTGLRSGAESTRRTTMITNEMPLKLTKVKDPPLMIMRRMSVKKASLAAEKFLRKYGEVILTADADEDIKRMLQTAEIVESRFRGDRMDVVYTVTSYPHRNILRHEMHGYLQTAMIHEMLD